MIQKKSLVGWWGFMLMALLFAVVLGGCKNDEIGSLPEAQGGGPLVVQKFTGGSIDINGFHWFEPCYYDGASDKNATMVTGRQGSRTENTFVSSSFICSPLSSSITYALLITADGTMPNVQWANQDGTYPATTPPGHSAINPATMVTISGNDGIGPFIFKTLLFYDDYYAPPQLVFGDNESGLSPLVNGYPTTMYAGGGAIRQ